MSTDRRRFWLITALLFGLLASACATEPAAVEAETPAEEVEAPEENVAPPETAAPAPATEAAPEEVEPILGTSPLFAGDFVDLNGQAIDFGSLEGQDTVLWFWAPW